MRFKMKVTRFLIPAICGLLSFLIVFVAVPELLARGCPDPMWMAIRVLAPVVLAVLLAGQICRIPSRYIWIGLPVQYLTLFFFQKPISKILGISLDGLPGLAYLFEAAVWPLLVTLAQFFALLFFGKGDHKS